MIAARLYPRKAPARILPQICPWTGSGRVSSLNNPISPMYAVSECVERILMNPGNGLAYPWTVRALRTPFWRSAHA